MSSPAHLIFKSSFTGTELCPHFKRHAYPAFAMAGLNSYDTEKHLKYLLFVSL